MKIYIDQCVDQKRIKLLAKRYKFQIVQANNLEDDIKIAEDVPKVFVLDLSRWDSGDYLAGDDIKPISKIIGTSTSSYKSDITHIYTAFHAKCDYFVTSNPKSFIRKTRKDPNSNEKR